MEMEFGIWLSSCCCLESQGRIDYQLWFVHGRNDMVLPLGGLSAFAFPPVLLYLRRKSCTESYNLTNSNLLSYSFLLKCITMACLTNWAEIAVILVAFLPHEAKARVSPSHDKAQLRRRRRQKFTPGKICQPAFSCLKVLTWEKSKSDSHKIWIHAKVFHSIWHLFGLESFSLLCSAVNFFEESPNEPRTEFIIARTKLWNMTFEIRAPSRFPNY